MKISTELSDLLKSMDYPAHKDDLVREAAREGIDWPELSRLRSMAPRSYSGRYDVLFELRMSRTGSEFAGATRMPAFA